MATSIARNASKTLGKAMVGYGIGYRSFCIQCRHLSSNKLIKKPCQLRHKVRLDQGVLPGLHSKQLCTCSGFWQHCKDEERKALEKFATELDVKEKPRRYKAWAPADDVYIIHHYPPKEVSFHEAMEMLRTQASWSFVPHCEYKDRTIVVSMPINLNLGPKPMAAFSNMIMFPHRFWKENKILCFAEGDDVKIAEECGADLIISKDRISEIADEELDVADFDFCVGTRAMLPHLSSIRSNLRDKFPNSKRGSAGNNIGLIIQRHKYGNKYRVLEDRGLINNFAIGNLGLTNEQIEENLQFLINDIYSYKPLSEEPFIKRVSISGYRLDGYRLKFQDYLPQQVEEEVDTRSELERIEDELRQLRAS